MNIKKTNARSKAKSEYRYVHILWLAKNIFIFQCAASHPQSFFVLVAYCICKNFQYSSDCFLTTPVVYIASRYIFRFWYLFGLCTFCVVTFEVYVVKWICCLFLKIIFIWSIDTAIVYYLYTLTIHTLCSLWWCLVLIFHSTSLHTVPHTSVDFTPIFEGVLIV